MTLERRRHFDLTELRDAAEHDGVSATTVYVGGPGWPAVLALVEVAQAAQAAERWLLLPSDTYPQKYDRTLRAARRRLRRALVKFEGGRS